MLSDRQAHSVNGHPTDAAAQPQQRRPNCRSRLRGGGGMASVRTRDRRCGSGRAGSDDHAWAHLRRLHSLAGGPRISASLAAVAAGVTQTPGWRWGNLGVINRNPVVIRDNLRIGDDEDLALAEVRNFREAGGDCLVEVTCCWRRRRRRRHQHGRNAPGLRRVAEQTTLKSLRAPVSTSRNAPGLRPH